MPVNETAEVLFTIKDFLHLLFGDFFRYPLLPIVEVKRKRKAKIMIAEIEEIKNNSVIEYGEIRRHILTHKHDTNTVIFHVLKWFTAIWTNHKIGIIG